MDKISLKQSLPLTTQSLEIRTWDRKDIDLMSQWPPYPFPHESFNYGFNRMSVEEKDHHYQIREENQDRITLVADHLSRKAIGYMALVEIDWEERCVGNMAIRLAHDKCGKGIGTEFLKEVTSWCVNNGMLRLRLNVAASNPRAIKCYLKTGYHISSEFWQDEAGINKFAIDMPEFDFLRPHIRFIGNTPQLRFYWMENVAR